MLYIVEIKDLSGKGLAEGSCLYSPEMPLSNIPLKYSIFDDSSNSLSVVNMSDLMNYHLQGIEVKGLQIRGTSESGELIASVTRPYFEGIIRLVSKKEVLDKGRFNIDYTSRFNFSGCIRELICGEGNKKYLLELSRNGLIYQSMFGANSRNRPNLGDVVVIDSILEDNSVSCLYEPVEKLKKYTLINIRSVMDLYVLALLEPSLVVGCDVVDNDKFIVDTLDAKYIFDVDVRLKYYLLKEKLLGWKCFGLG